MNFFFIYSFNLQRFLLYLLEIREKFINMHSLTLLLFGACVSCNIFIHNNQ